MAEPPSSPQQRPLPDGLVPEAVVARTESRWFMIMAVMLAVMMVVLVVTSVAGALHPSSNVEVIEPLTLHLGGEFVESNLGTAIEPDGSATVRLIGEQYDFVPHCVRVPAETPVKFRLTSADVVHGFLLPIRMSTRWWCRASSPRCARALRSRASTKCRVTSFAASGITPCGHG